MADNSTLCDDGGAGSEELTANILGIIGGLMLAVCLAPQLIQTWRTKSVDDVAYGWLATYFSGLILNLVYFILIDAVVAWATLSLEIAFCITMIIMKVLFTTKPGDNPEEPPQEATGAGSLEDKGAEANEKQIHRVASGRFVGTFSKTKSMRPTAEGFSLGRHYVFDYTFARVAEAATLESAVLSLMKQVCDESSVLYTHAHIESFAHNDGNTPAVIEEDDAGEGGGRDSNPSQNFSALLLSTDANISHIAAHCFPDRGLVALDIFSGGGKPQIASSVAKALHAGILALPHFVNIEGRYRDVARFPSAVNSRTGSGLNLPGGRKGSGVARNLAVQRSGSNRGSNGSHMDAGHHAV